MKVVLLEHTPHPDEVVAAAARLCYSASDIGTIRERLGGSRARDLVLKLLNLGHESPLEHVSFTFGIEEVSRALSHQLVRHRIASYSQQSQRYVKMGGFSYVLPPSIAENKEARQKFEQLMGDLQESYGDLLRVVPAEDARYILPNACTTKLIATFNARSLYNFFTLRLCTRSQWEIRALAWEMLKLAKVEAPAIFSAAGPDCWGPHGCGEGEMSCRQPPERI
ncbi:MAG: thymidylate synthase (FAD) [Bacillota bacterium]|nr:MAG: thymidylate synthase (FAD) [Bacillota bacterium]